jgi:hypothetical protein
MPLLRVRFTVRRMMVAVAIIAVGAWGASLIPLAAEYRQRAWLAARAEEVLGVLEDAAQRAEQTAGRDADAEGGQIERPWDDLVSLAIRPQAGDPVLADSGTAAASAREAAHYGRLRQRCASLKAKYDRAARYPWLPVAPDPPAPE